MKKILFLVPACAALATLAIGHDHEEFRKTMKQTAAGFSGLRKAVDARQGPEAAADAENLVPLFKQVQKHFEEHKIRDGIQWAKTAQKAAGQLAAAAKSGEWDKVSTEEKAIGSACQNCHAAHREKLPGGGFKMK